jgi:hypothetical protein
MVFAACDTRLAGKSAAGNIIQKEIKIMIPGLSEKLKTLEERLSKLRGYL